MRIHYIKTLQITKVCTPDTHEELLNNIQQKGYIPYNSPHYVVNVEGMGSWPFLSQEQLMELLPFGTDFAVAIDMMANIIQIPMGAIPLTREFWDEHDLDNSPNIFHFLPQESKQLHKHNNLFLPVDKNTDKEGFIKMLKSVKSTTKHRFSDIIK